MKSDLRSSLLLAGLVAVSASFVSAQQAQETPPAPAPAVDAANAADEVDDYATAAVRVYDPIEPVNRAMFAFNNGLYGYVFRPVSKGYVRVVPQPARKGIGNFFENLRFPIRFVNSALQGKFTRAGKETGKFVVNTVAGVGGFLRVSDDVPALADIPSEDTGQTLGVWRLGHGPFLVLPVFGPSSARDAVGSVGDYFLNPLNWNLRENLDHYGWEEHTAVTTVNTVNSLPGLLAAYDAARKDAVDPYVAVRSSYIQYRDASVKR